MSARPRLVHEGSPIIDDGGRDVRPFSNTNNNHGEQHQQHAHPPKDAPQFRSNLAAYASTASKQPSTTTKTKTYKLHTRLVIGDSNNIDKDNSVDDLDLDTMSMDEEEDNQQQQEKSGSRSYGHINQQHSKSGASSVDHSTSGYYAAHGHHLYGSHQVQPQQHSSQAPAFVDNSTSSYYGQHGHVNYGSQGQHEQYQQQSNLDHTNNMQFATQQSHHHQQHHMHHQQNNTFGAVNLSHEPSSTPHVSQNYNIQPLNAPSQVCQMPPPSTSPLVVIDGANIAYNYADSLNPLLQQSSQRRQPNPKGITLAIEWFLKHSCRVQAVVPISWYQLKPRPADVYHLQNRSRGDSDAKMITEEVEELRTLRQRGLLVACPPGDDDDAYAIALARREEGRLQQQKEEEHHAQEGEESMGMEEDTATHQHLPKSVLGGYVVSNDFFHDAVRRDERKANEHHSNRPLSMRPASLKSWLKKNRISYSFANIGSSLDGEMQLEFLPNPRNDLIEAIDAISRLNSMR